MKSGKGLVVFALGARWSRTPGTVHRDFEKGVRTPCDGAEMGEISMGRLKMVSV